MTAKNALHSSAERRSPALLPAVFAVAALLLQCLAMLSAPAVYGVSASDVAAHHAGDRIYSAGPAETGHGYNGALADTSPGYPAMSCCDDEQQPVTLAELQLLPLIFSVLLFAVFAVTARSGKPGTRLLSPRVRLHKLHCCWLH